MHKEPSLWVALGLVGITAVSGGVLMAPQSRATVTTSDQQATTATVTVSSTCSMSKQVTTPHVATLLNGQYSAGANGPYSNGIGSTTIKALCNDPAGFSIYAIGFTNNVAGNNKLTSATLGSTYDIVSGTAESGDTSNWAMKVAAVSATVGSKDQTPTLANYFKDGSGNPKYVTVPSTNYEQVASFNSNTDATTGSSITTTYAAYIAGTQPAGTYSGQVAFMLVHPSEANASPNPKYYAMQNVAQWASDLQVGDTATVIDVRDQHKYTVARLCTDTTWNGVSAASCGSSQIWMTQNLDLIIDPSVTYTHADTDLGWTSSNNGATWTPGATLTTPATIPTATFYYQDSAQTTDALKVVGWTNSTTAPYQAEGGNLYTNGYNVSYASLTQCVAAGNTQEACEHYHIGNYYNWPAAVAVGSDDANVPSAQYGVAANSICPAGWRLPKGLTKDGSNNTVMSEFNQVLKANGIVGTTLNPEGIDLSGDNNVGYASDAFTKMVGAPFWFVRSGGVNDVTLWYATNAGYYWSSSASSSSNAYYLGFYSGYLGPAYYYNRGRGFSVRCVAR